MKNKIILLTGITDGLGRHIIELLAENNNTYILIGRNKEKLKKIETLIQQKNKNSKVDIYVSDLSLLNEVKISANQIKEKHPVIDYLIHNAGAVPKDKGQKTKEGLNFALALNYLSPLLITETVRSSLSASNSPIIYYTTTQMMPQKFNSKEIDEIANLTAMKSYSVSKLMFCLYLENLANHFNFDIKIFDPTTMYTSTLTKVFPDKLQWLSPIAKLFSKSPEKVAQSVVKILNKNDNTGTIHYYILDKLSEPKADLKNQKLQNNVISFGENLLNATLKK